jgi:replicative DNA helicase
VFNPGSERNIISICLKESERIVDVEGEEIFAEHFSVPGNKYIYMAMIYLFSKKIKSTPMSIMEVLSNETAKKSVDELGGLEYLTLLAESNVPSENLTIFIEKIKQSYTRRMLYQIALDLKDFVLSDKSEVLNPAELVHHLEQKIGDLAVNTTSSDEVYKMGDETEAVLAERAEHPAQVPGLEVGWDEYDRVTNGGQPGDLIIICAESKVGKSVTLTNWADKISIDDKLPVLYIDTEMQSREQEDRILSMRTGIPHEEIVSGMYVMDTPFGTAIDKVAKLKVAREELKLGNYYHIYMPQFTIEKVSALARKFQIQVGIVALFFDYIKIPSNQANFRDAQEYQRLGFFTSGLKDLAGILKIPVWSACQANRSDLGGENPSATTIGGSYRILQLASKLMFLTNKSDERIAKDGYQNGNQQLYIKYQRNGASDVPPINIMFHKHIIKQVEI